ncbi:unnamed protein product [Kuraishia capsulata CBS 1993]|uniref:GST N-terminal domain-containing protein n=1 Tax=Kuraishia capsulata CBS 1993 TaxID=1382522 RepID=W6MXR7_9ASCO|nr:uncharacterized protein KUCA_T00005348001 [Kuraishia capsulata CBS 1993]CDK29360.1 unnamed protein product [Kuraishia capsulata CBS 1993]
MSSYPKFTIYDFPTGPYPARVRIALGEKKLEHLAEFELIDLFKGTHKKPEFRENLNFSGTVPVVKFENGDLLAECTAITEFLDSLDGNTVLTGLTPRERGDIHMFTRRVENEFLEPISLYFHNATPGLGPDVETYQNHEWGLRQREKGLRGMRYFNKLLVTREFVTCDRFTMADMALVAAMVFLAVVKEPVPADCDALLAWWARVQLRPSVINRVTMSQ